jgi:GDP-L-fucose synthase
MSNFMEKDARIYVAGHRGLAGSAILRNLQTAGYSNLIVATHRELDLTDRNATFEFLQRNRPDFVFMAAAKVGGILANHRAPADFIAENLAIELNTIVGAKDAGVKRLLFLGSSCIYPKSAPQPMREEYLLASHLEETNRAYAVAKIAGIELCRSFNRQYGTRFLSVMPTNLYGNEDNFELETSHVLPALLRKMHDAKVQGLAEIHAWGTGRPRREFLHSDDMAEGCVFLMNLPDEQYSRLLDANGIVNLGTGIDIEIRELAELIRHVVGYTGAITWDASIPDGTERKLLDISRMAALGWSPKISLREGICSVYAHFEKGARQWA